MNPRCVRAYYNLVMIYNIKGDRQQADKYEQIPGGRGYAIAEPAFRVQMK